MVVYRFRRLLASTIRSKSALIPGLFYECGQSAITFIGYNDLFGVNHVKSYTVDDEMCAAVIHDAKCHPILNQHLECDIFFSLSLSLSLPSLNYAMCAICFYCSSCWGIQLQ